MASSPDKEPENHGYINKGEHKGNIYFGLRDAPPPYHPNAIKCYQCPKYTWRNTPDCVHCGADIHYYLECQKVKAEISYTVYRIERLSKWLIGVVALIGLSIVFDYLWLTVVSFVASTMLSSYIGKLQVHKNNLRDRLY